MYVSKEPYKISPGCVYNINYHFVWCPKYRKAVLVGEVKEDLEKLIKEKARELEIEIVGMEIMPDHIHLFVSAKPTIAIHSIIRQLKGYSSHFLREKYEHLRKKLPTLWSRSYYVGTAGFVSQTVIQNYIAQQKGK